MIYIRGTALPAGRGPAPRVQRPAVAVLMFVGLFWFWLIAPVHFVAMLDPVLCKLMNWTMALDGILFWALALDTRARPSARLCIGLRAAPAPG